MDKNKEILAAWIRVERQLKAGKLFVDSASVQILLDFVKTHFSETNIQIFGYYSFVRIDSANCLAF
jgi:hypothetical protein